MTAGPHGDKVPSDRTPSRLLKAVFFMHGVTIMAKSLTNKLQFIYLGAYDIFCVVGHGSMP